MSATDVVCLNIHVTFTFMADRGLQLQYVDESAAISRSRYILFLVFFLLGFELEGWVLLYLIVCFVCWGFVIVVVVFFLWSSQVGSLQEQERENTRHNKGDNQTYLKTFFLQWL